MSTDLRPADGDSTQAGSAGVPDDADTGLRCPNCEYNLTGLVEERCPECGSGFDRELLLRRSSNLVCHATPWDETDQSLDDRFLATWLLATARPRKLAHDFPRRHHASRARSYSYLCYAIGAWGPWALMCVAWCTASPVKVLLEGIIALSCTSFAFIACWSCEMSIAAWVAACFVGTPMPLGSDHFWRGLMHYTSGSCLITAAWATWGAVLYVKGPVIASKLAVPWLAIALAIFLWWVFQITAIIRERTPPGWHRILACAGVPICGILWILLWVFASFFTFILLRPSA